MTINYELTPQRKDGTYGVRIVVCNGRGSNNRKRISTNIIVEKKDVAITYNKEHTHARTKIKNQRLLDKIEEFVIQCRKNYAGEEILRREPVPTNEAVDIMLGKNNLPTFFAFANKWVEENKNKGKKNYVTALNSFRQFLDGKDIRFEELTYTLLTQYCQSLNGKERAQTMYLGAIRHIWNEAEVIYDEQMPHTPFKKFKVPKQKMKGQRAVDIDVVLQIINSEPESSRAELARDCYILSLGLLGMNSADLYDCSYYKNGVLIYDRMKTRTRRDDAHMEIVVPEYLKPLFAKYADPTGVKVFNFYQRYGTIQDFNRSLNIGLHSILDGVTFYSARHTWATIARNEIGASKSDVNDGLIHVDRGMDVTDIYIKRDYRAVNRLNQQVLDWVLEQKNLLSSQTGGRQKHYL